MKLGFFNDFVLGVVADENIVDVSTEVSTVRSAHPQDVIRAVIERWEEFSVTFARAAESREGVPISSVRMRPPLPRPGNIDCMAVNYMENGTRSEPAPINAFLKASNSVVGCGDSMVLSDVPATIFEGEAELGVVIGRHGSNLAASDVMQHVFGYINLIDGSARGLKPVGNTFYQIKSRDTFCPIGPFIVTADEVPDPQSLQVKLWNNGVLMQDFNTDDMAHKIPRCIEFVSSVHAIEPGDVLATGTNHRGLNPFMDGDHVEMEISGLGRLFIEVRDDLRRTWQRQTRLERSEAGLEGATSPQLSGKYAEAGLIPPRVGV